MTVEGLSYYASPACVYTFDQLVVLQSTSRGAGICLYFERFCPEIVGTYAYAV